MALVTGLWADEARDDGFCREVLRTAVDFVPRRPGLCWLPCSRELPTGSSPTGIGEFVAS